MPMKAVTRQMRVIETVIVQQDLDPYFTIRALASYSSHSARTLRGFLRDGPHQLPHFRLGQPGRGGRRGGKIVIRKSEFDTWMVAWRAQQASPPRNLSAIIERAVAQVGKRKGAAGTPGKRGQRDGRSVGEAGE